MKISWIFSVQTTTNYLLLVSFRLQINSTNIQGTPIDFFFKAIVLGSGVIVIKANSLPSRRSQSSSEHHWRNEHTRVTFPALRQQKVCIIYMFCVRFNQVIKNLPVCEEALVWFGLAGPPPVLKVPQTAVPSRAVSLGFRERIGSDWSQSGLQIFWSQLSQRQWGLLLY